MQDKHSLDQRLVAHIPTASETLPLKRPADGLPPVAATSRDIAAAAATLASGTGPVAVDTERASGFVYGDRAFLIQLRRAGAGTLLIDPENHRDDVRHMLGPVMKDLDWVIHAAHTDLPCLAWMGLYPCSLFDTELAGRLAGLPKVNLGAMVENILGLILDKGHAREDWSTRPLPTEWLTYAALDVEVLLELAAAMAEILDKQGKLLWAEEEFDWIVRSHAHMSCPTPADWSSLKGLHSLRTQKSRAVAKALWMHRDRLAQQSDRSPHLILTDKAICAVAHACPTTKRELAAIAGFPTRRRGACATWLPIVVQALATPPENCPELPHTGTRVPPRAAWSHYPLAHEAWTFARKKLTELSTRIHVPVENIIQPASLREVLWRGVEEKTLFHYPADIIAALKELDVRLWQQECSVPIIIETFRHVEDTPLI